MKLSDVFNHFKSSVTCWSGGEMSSWDSTWVHTGFYSKKVRQFFSEQTVLQTFAPDTLSKMTLRLSVLYRWYPDHISYWEHCTWHTWYHSFSQHWFHGPISQCNLHLTDTNLVCVTMRPFPHCKFTPCLSKGLTATRVTQTATGTRLPSRVADGWCSRPSSSTGSHCASEARKTSQPSASAAAEAAAPMGPAQPGSEAGRIPSGWSYRNPCCTSLRTPSWECKTREKDSSTGEKRPRPSSEAAHRRTWPPAAILDAAGRSADGLGRETTAPPARPQTGGGERCGGGVTAPRTAGAYSRSKIAFEKTIKKRK